MCAITQPVSTASREAESSAQLGRQSSLLNLLDSRCKNDAKEWVPKLEMHAAADETRFDKRSGPARANDFHQDRSRTEQWMTRNQELIARTVFDSINSILCPDVQYGAYLEFVQKHAPVHFRLANVPVDFVGQVRVADQEIGA